jgi:hypothetical protein
VPLVCVFCRVITWKLLNEVACCHFDFAERYTKRYRLNFVLLFVGQI